MIIAATGSWLVGLGAALAGVGSLLTGLAALRSASHKEEDHNEQAAAEAAAEAGFVADG